MRTTLELDDDLVATAKDMARQKSVSLGRIISELARQSLAAKTPQKVRNGVLLFAPKPGALKSNLHTVNALRDEV